MHSTKNYYLTLMLCSVYGMFGAHLFYLGRSKDGMIRILQTIFVVGIFFWLWDLFQLIRHEDRFLDEEGKALSKWYGNKLRDELLKIHLQNMKFLWSVLKVVGAVVLVVGAVGAANGAAKSQTKKFKFKKESDEDNQLKRGYKKNYSSDLSNESKN